MSEESRGWYRMTRPLFNSGFEDDEFWAFGQDGFQEILDSVLGSDVLIYDKSLNKSPVKVRAIVQNKTSDVYNSTNIRQILCNIGVLKCGQYVRIDNGYWLVSTLPDNNRIYEKAVLWKCKYTLRFLSPLTGEVVEYPVYNLNSTQYGTGESEKEHMTVGDGQHLVYLPYNEETILIDDRFRFIMDRNRESPSVFRVTQVDTSSYAVGGELEDGLLQWSVIETQFNAETDNKELMIADYYTKDPGSIQGGNGEGSGLYLTDLDGDYILTIGETKRIRVGYRSPDGAEATGVVYKAELNPNSGDFIRIEQSEDTILLHCKKDTSQIGKAVVLSVSAPEHGSNASMKIQIAGW